MKGRYQRWMLGPASSRTGHSAAVHRPARPVTTSSTAYTPHQKIQGRSRRSARACSRSFSGSSRGWASTTDSITKTMSPASANSSPGRVRGTRRCPGRPARAATRCPGAATPSCASPWTDGGQRLLVGRQGGPPGPSLGSLHRLQAVFRIQLTHQHLQPRARSSSVQAGTSTSRPGSRYCAKDPTSVASTGSPADLAANRAPLWSMCR
jgi:hypothetical protein